MYQSCIQILKYATKATVAPSTPEIGNLRNSRSLAVINWELRPERCITALFVWATGFWYTRSNYVQWYFYRPN